MRPPIAHLAPLLGALLAACAASPVQPERDAVPAPELAPHAPEEMPCVLDGAGVFYVASADATRPRVRYADGQVGLGDHCAIRTANKLNRRIPPVYVNGRPIGFC